MKGLYAKCATPDPPPTENNKQLVAAKPAHKCVVAVPGNKKGGLVAGV